MHFNTSDEFRVHRANQLVLALTNAHKLFVGGGLTLCEFDLVKRKIIEQL